ncbi:exodeoxyribonuclease V subunit beta [Chitinophaga silvatica]|uniref:RecBCD enzyme subunit RecB n=1 Tax=Chitinophaga silvatica TaxID=2282649 RepID=A0A3E1Y1Z2_9BACT|nr:exodeoxyribonuclease V subunit beta [Chitinophaga silvatica]RFS18663.1 exodeoxyribonuclease V subunit beta [Chitinophaga silvatica]
MIESAVHNKFDASTVALKGSNLIEASAGTGKTYSIAILVLRLILEEKLSIKEILMVTFTRAAVAELEDRIRRFLRMAYKASLGKDPKDPVIFELVLNAIDPANPQPIQQRLRDAVLLLDETSVLTIHGFCQQTLTEFAFETNQPFGAEMVPDLTPIIENEINKFWRRHITTLDTEILKHIYYPELKDNLFSVVKDHLGGKRYLTDIVATDITEAQQAEWISSLKAFEDEIETINQAMYEYIITESIHLSAECLKQKNAKTEFAPIVGQPKLLVAKLIERRRTKKVSDYIKKIFPVLLSKLDEQDEIKNELENFKLHITQHFYCLAIQIVEESIQQLKANSSTMDFDDVINNLHTALVKKESTDLAQALQQKYKAVFVDEFQDTDRQQFEIFDRAFGSNTILFYIGDPKQSIYGWRKADIYTYFNAKKGVQELYDMNQNYRSTENLILAMNKFFKPHSGFDTFHFAEEEDSIDYIDVESPQPNKHGTLCYGETEVTPIDIFTGNNKDQIVLAVAAQVAELLSDHQYKINGEKIKSSDIGILVRTGDEGILIKKALATLGIPAVTIDESKVLASAEAVQLLHLLEAMEAPDRSSINRALLCSFTGFNSQTILQLDDALTLNLFNKYNSYWLKDGVYTAIMEFVSDFDVRHKLLDKNSATGERVITNLFQLAELVHQVQSRKNLSIRDLLTWLKRGIDGMSTEGDEYTQRVESDEDSVNIVTIHKSKGLEYDIVFAPFLDLVAPKNPKFVSFRDPVSGQYFYMESNRLTDEQKGYYTRQLIQENRRLIYVAITRAVYKCFIYKNGSNYYKNSSLTDFIIALTQHPAPASLINLSSIPDFSPEKYQQSKAPVAPISAPNVDFRLQEENWRKMSYTMLAAKGTTVSKGKSTAVIEGYDNFIFNTLKRGAKTGNLLHFIFEHINFSDNSQWAHWIEEAIRHFVPGQRSTYLEPLNEMLQHIMYAPINIGEERFQLASVGRFQRLAEFEFDFPVPIFQANRLTDLTDDEITVNVRHLYEHHRQELEGIMNGKIDLFFEHQGKYYVLDWKSNYLGDTLTDYDSSGLAAAMNENNYHLQYLIYTVAVKKYLESRIPQFNYAKQFGGVIYCFIRGIRNSGNTGIFTVHPSLEKIRLLERLLTK